MNFMSVFVSCSATTSHNRVSPDLRPFLGCKSHCVSALYAPLLTLHGKGMARNSKPYLQEQVLAQCACNVTANRQQVINLFGDVKEAESKGAQVC